MLSEDQYVERTPDLVAKVRRMHEAAEKQMNRFTEAPDYDVRRVAGRKPKEPPRPAEQLPLPVTNDPVQMQPGAAQPAAPAPSVSAEHGDEEGSE